LGKAPPPTESNLPEIWTGHSLAGPDRDILGRPPGVCCPQLRGHAPSNWGPPTATTSSSRPRRTLHSPCGCLLPRPYLSPLPPGAGVLGCRHRHAPAQPCTLLTLLSCHISTSTPGPLPPALPVIGSPLSSTRMTGPHLLSWFAVVASLHLFPTPLSYRLASLEHFCLLFPCNRHVFCTRTFPATVSSPRSSPSPRPTVTRCGQPPWLRRTCFCWRRTSATRCWKRLGPIPSTPPANAW